MAFIISKKSTLWGKTRKLYYLVENYRDGNKIKRKKLLNLNECKSLAEFFNSTEQEEAELLNRLNKYEKELDDFIKYGKTPPFSFGSPYRIRQRLDMSIEQAKADLKECQSRKE